MKNKGEKYRIKSKRSNPKNDLMRMKWKGLD